MNLNDLPTGKAPDAINVLITIPKGSKLEFTLEGVLKVADFLPIPSMLEGDYGLVPQTKGGNGKPLGAVVLGHELPAGCLIECRPIGVLKLAVKRAFEDILLCVPLKDQRYKNITELEDVPDHIPLEIANFYKQYSTASIRGWKGSAASKKVIIHATELFKKRGSNV